MMIRCPNCGYEGKGKELGTSCLDLLTAIFLLCLGIIPGIIFLVWQQGKAHKVVCPACGFKNVVRLPKSQQAQPPQSLLSRLQPPQVPSLEPQPLQPQLPSSPKPGAFTKQQIAILAGLACAVFCVLGGGGYIVISGETTSKAPAPQPTVFKGRATWTPWPKKTPTPTPDLGDEYMASQYCKEAIQNQLRIPKSAKFDAGKSPERFYEGGLWHIVGKVEAQNAFGAMLPYQYYCKVQYLGGGWPGRYTVLVADLF